MAASSYDRRPIFPESRCPRAYSVPSLAGVMGVEEGVEEGRGDQPYEAWAICLRDHAAEAQRATARPARHRQLHLLRLTSALRSACTSGAWCVGGSCGRMTRRVESLVRLTRHRQARTRGDRRGHVAPRKRDANQCETTVLPVVQMVRSAAHVVCTFSSFPEKNTLYCICHSIQNNMALVCWMRAMWWTLCDGCEAVRTKNSKE